MSEPATQLARLAGATLWPAFVAAGVLELLVFALVDPGQLHGIGGAALDWGPGAVYTVAFFVFWIVVSGAAFVTAALLVGVPGSSNDSPGLNNSRR